MSRHTKWTLLQIDINIVCVLFFSVKSELKRDDINRKSIRVRPCQFRTVTSAFIASDKSTERRTKKKRNPLKRKKKTGGR